MRGGKPALRSETIRVREVARRVMRGPLRNRYRGLSTPLVMLLDSHGPGEVEECTPLGIYWPFTKAPGEILGGVSANGG